ncbi:MAG TPA: phosphoribosylaminoimidazolesuccinocarboxamide synthase [Chloroflexota bacterium]|nr:phosphoribosylaminoimidazolesuccinocarboxamide synthase [Chloroflexota bacterium]
MAHPLLTESRLDGVPFLFRGKVRDVYDLGDHLLLVATDRISAFDVVLPTPIPDKGAVLNQLSAYWFGRTRGIVPNHLLSTDVQEYPESVRRHADQLVVRSMLARKARRIDVECVVRGYLAGSAWAEYSRQQTVCGQKLPPGLLMNDRLAEPIFTPATKAASGHDENMSVKAMASVVGSDLTREIVDVSLRIYQFAREYALTRGLILADTKLEFGILDDRLILIDELLTPDSSRYWDAELYEPGRDQPSFDKQFVRDWLESSGWNKEPPAPVLPPDVVVRTSQKYGDAYRRLVGSPLPGGAP